MFVINNMKKKFLFIFYCLIISFGIFLNGQTARACICSCTKTANNISTTCIINAQSIDTATCESDCQKKGMTLFSCDAPGNSSVSLQCATLENSNNNAEEVSFSNPVPILDNKSVASIVGLIIKALLGILGSLALCIFIYAGFIWMFAQGNSTKIKHAVDIMKYCALGIAVIYLSYAMLKFVFGIIK